MKFSLLLTVLLSLFSYSSLKKGGGGGAGGRGSSGGGRGSSGSRSGGGGGSSSGSRSSGGGSSYGSGFSSSGSSGIFKSSASRTIAAGLGGAAVGYMGAKVAHRLASGTSSMYLPAYHRTYYYGNRNYVNAYDQQKLVCRYVINNDDEVFDIYYDDGGRVTEILYECNAKNEQCCDGLDCCNKQTLPWWAILIIVVAIFLFIICLVVACVKCLKRTKGINDTNQAKVPDTQVAHIYYQPPPIVQPNGYYPPPQPAQNFDGFTPTYAQMGLPNPYVEPGYPRSVPPHTGFDYQQQPPPVYQPQSYPAK